MGTQFREVKLQLDECSTKAKTSSESVSRLSSELAELCDKIEESKEHAEGREAGSSDTSPLVRVKAALQQLKTEMMNLDLRLGVVSNSLLTAKHQAAKSARTKELNKNRKKNNKKLVRRNGDRADVDVDESYESVESD